MIVASSRNRGKTDVLVDLARQLGRFVEQAVREGSTLDECERGVWTRLLEMGHAAADWFLKAQGDGDLGESISTEEGTMLQRSDTLVRRALRTIFGEHAFENPHHRFWAHQKKSSFPHPPPGVLAGGPNSRLQDPTSNRLGVRPPQRCYIDHVDAWSVNEVAINWNAPLAWVAAFLDDQGRAESAP